MTTTARQRKSVSARGQELRSTPVDVLCQLDPKRLAAQVFDRYGARGEAIRSRALRQEAAWLSFGKPGRDPNMLAGVVSQLAVDDTWTPHLQLAQLRDHWDQVVGPAIAQHSMVSGFAHGVLTIGTSSPAWATQLTYMIPQLTEAIRAQLDALDIEEIRVTGPRTPRRR